MNAAWQAGGRDAGPRTSIARLLPHRIVHVKLHEVSRRLVRIGKQRSIGVKCSRHRLVAIDGLAVRDQAARPIEMPNYGIVAGCAVRGARRIPIRSHLSTCMEHS
ncbi:hypothetical protein [Burkholderia ambifaria]|uniref:hypothetical protein n=1 Tax=Burkholderia ambifaria TaxID=152480 RepID=UPI00158D4FB9|nr:hypothetical protein [Burkholderia ambifaria]